MCRRLLGFFFLFWAAPAHNSPNHTTVQRTRSRQWMTNRLRRCVIVRGPTSALSEYSTSTGGSCEIKRILLRSVFILGIKAIKLAGFPTHFHGYFPVIISGFCHSSPLYVKTKLNKLFDPTEMS